MLSPFAAKAIERADIDAVEALADAKDEHAEHDKDDENGEADGEFDYIIAHGVYSWAPQVVRDKIMDVFARNLAPAGVAYVSYNVLPGWHLSAAIRELVLYRLRKFPSADSRERLRIARGVLDFLCSPTGMQGR